MKTLHLFIITAFLLLSFTGSAQHKDDLKLIKDANKAIETLRSTQPKLNTYFDQATGYVVFPNVGKGGFIVGAAAGNGVLYENNRPVGMADLKKINLGFQAGGQAIIEVIFFEHEDALREFKSGSYQFSAEATAVALKSGVAIDAKYKDGVAVFTLPKAGLMADITIGGQKFSFKAF